MFIQPTIITTMFRDPHHRSGHNYHLSYPPSLPARRSRHEIGTGERASFALRTWQSSVHLITDTDLVSLNNYQISFEQRGKGKLRIIYTPNSCVVFSSCIFLQNSCGKRLNQRSTCRSMSLHMRVGG